jgi:hypothetical protein
LEDATDFEELVVLAAVVVTLAVVLAAVVVTLTGVDLGVDLGVVLGGGGGFLPPRALAFTSSTASLAMRAAFCGPETGAA